MVRVARGSVMCALLLTGCVGEIGVPSVGHEQSVDPASSDSASAEGATVEGSEAREDAENGEDDRPDNVGGQGTGGGDESDPDPDSSATVADVPAAHITIAEVALYQGVKITIARDGRDLTDRNAQVVAGRPGLLRVFVAPESSFSSQPLTARLELSASGRDPITRESQLTVTGRSSDGDPESTFNFELSGDDITTDTEYAVTLLERVGDAPAAAPGAARFPETGLTALGALGAGSAFRVVVVPIRYDADGSGRAPQLNAAAVEALRKHVFRVFPTHAVEVSVRAPIDFGQAVLADGSGWSELLDKCLAQRNADGVDPRTYYYCMFNPAPDFRTYCRSGCVAGLGPVPGSRDTFSRAAIGLGIGDVAGTMAHELGHTLGRPHAPCGGVAGPDPSFPYGGGRIGSWGYDLTRGELLSPDSHTDLMGYCDGAWISDYNYDLIFQRFRSVLAAPRAVTEPQSVISIVVDADQRLSFGHALTVDELPGTSEVTGRYLDGAGTVMEEVTGRFSPASHTNGGLVYVPVGPREARALVLDGFGQLAL
jgi:hypothetical protein